eukprot:12009144-Alexandrium_andersonii.AAC.1
MCIRDSSATSRSQRRRAHRILQRALWKRGAVVHTALKLPSRASQPTPTPGAQRKAALAASVRGIRRRATARARGANPQ